MFQDLILELLGTGPKSTEELLIQAHLRRPAECTGELCLHNDSEFNCHYEWQHQLCRDLKQLATEKRCMLQEGVWRLVPAHVARPAAERRPIDLSTTYLGWKLRNPLIISACPLSAEPDVLRRVEQLGAAAAVMPSLFEEQVDITAPDYATTHAGRRWTGSLYQYRQLTAYNGGPAAYLKHLVEAKRVVSMPIIGSLNVTHLDGWLKYARHIEDSGADALELNTYFVATNPKDSAADIENRHLELVSAVRSQISIPLAVKIGPYFTALPHFANRLVQAGASGLVLFNRYLQADLDLSRMDVKCELSLSTATELRATLRALAILRGELTCSLGATGGVDAATDILKAVLVGADAVLIASSLYRHGVDQVSKLLEEVAAWLQERGYQSLAEIRGSLSQSTCPNPFGFERANYMNAVSSFTEG